MRVAGGSAKRPNPDRRLVDFETGFIDHNHGAVLTVGIEIDRDLPRDQVGGLLGLMLAFAIEPNRILKSNAVGNIKMKNRHGPPPVEVNARDTGCVPEFLKR